MFSLTNIFLILLIPPTPFCYQPVSSLQPYFLKNFPHCLSNPTDSFLVGLPGGLDDKGSVCNVGDPGSIPASGRPPGEGNGNPPQYSCLENPINEGVWRIIVIGDAKSQTRLRTNTLTLQWTQTWCQPSCLAEIISKLLVTKHNEFFPFLSYTKISQQHLP